MQEEQEFKAISSYTELKVNLEIFSQKTKTALMAQYLKLCTALTENCFQHPYQAT